MRVCICASWAVLALVLGFGVLDAGQRSVQAADVPEGWRSGWTQPPPGDRPLQIVHGIDPRYALPEGVEQMVPSAGAARPAPRGMRYYLEQGLGGVVCNVAFDDYLRSERNWQTLVAAVRQCEQLGLVVWLYDEHGYPSGAAGGLVLAEDPQYEAQELAFDAQRDEPFEVRPAYEHTHANNNYHASRRYANLIDDRAVRSFVAQTHEAYWQRLQPFFGKTIEATFTDEPSLIAVNLGSIPEPARSRVPVVDAPRPEAKPLPSVPWGYDLAERYRERFGEDLLPARRSLFEGDRPEDRHVRRQYWSLIADLISDRYFGALQRWCAAHGIASSGHGLWEEALLHHVPLEGNGLKALTRMDIPGLDMLSSDPEAVIHSGWLTAALPCSAALLTGRRRVMTEVSDFSQKMAGAGPAKLDEMQATAGWQAAWGVTDFTLYYGIRDRSTADYRAYCDFVGRLNAVLKPAQPTPEVLLYYPVYDLWAEYLPTAEPLRLESQSARAQRLVTSFLRIGQTLQRRQIPFSLIDHEWLASATVRADGKLAVGERAYQALILPELAELPAEAAAVAEAFRRGGGRVLSDAGETPAALVEQLSPAQQLAPAEPRVALGRFTRDGRRILLLVNVGREEYRGNLAGDTAGPWLRMDPASGDIQPCVLDSAGQLPVLLAARQSVLLVQGASVE